MTDKLTEDENMRLKTRLPVFPKYDFLNRVRLASVGAKGDQESGRGMGKQGCCNISGRESTKIGRGKGTLPVNKTSGNLRAD